MNTVLGIIKQKRNSKQFEYLLGASVVDYGEYTGFYYPVGGNNSDNTDEKEFLKSKVKDEVGLDVDPQDLIAETKSDIKGKNIKWYACRVIGGRFSIDFKRLIDAKFVTEDEMSQMKIWPATIKFFNKYIF